MFVSDHDPNLKGNVAELKIAAEAARLGIPVLRPMTEHERYDLVFELAGEFKRVQCKWARSKRRCRPGPIRDRIAAAETASSGRNTPLTRSMRWPRIAPNSMNVSTCQSTLIEGTGAANLRLAPPRNGQRAALHFAADYRLGAIAQLGERPAGSRRSWVRAPLAPLPPPVTVGAHEYREKLGWYMERAAAGESFLITRRGKPYARLSPPTADTVPRPCRPPPTSRT